MRVWFPGGETSVVIAKGSVPEQDVGDKVGEEEKEEEKERGGKEGRKLNSMVNGHRNKL